MGSSKTTYHTRDDVIRDDLMSLRQSLLTDLQSLAPDCLCEVFFNVQLSSIRSFRDTRAPDIFGVAVPIVVVVFKNEDVVGSAAFNAAVKSGTKVRRRWREGTSFRGQPAFAVLWREQPCSTVAQRYLSRVGVRFSLCPEYSPYLWIQEEIRSNVLAILESDALPELGLISDEQFQIGCGLREFEYTTNRIAALAERDRKVAVLQEVYAPLVIENTACSTDSGLARKSFDFVFYRSSKKNATSLPTWNPYFIVEYDGKQHNKDNRKQTHSDNTKNEACLEAGIPLLRIWAEHLPPNPLYKGKRALVVQEFFSDIAAQLAGDLLYSDRRQARQDREFFRGVGLLLKSQQTGDWGEYDLWRLEEDSERLAEKGMAEKEYYVGLREATGIEWQIQVADTGEGWVKATIRNLTNNVCIPRYPRFKVQFFSKRHKLDSTDVAKRLLLNCCAWLICDSCKIDRLDAPRVSLYENVDWV